MRRNPCRTRSMFSEPSLGRWASKQQSTDLARAKALRLGDADPSNLSPGSWRRDAHCRDPSSQPACARPTHRHLLGRGTPFFCCIQRGRSRVEKGSTQPANGNYGGPEYATSVPIIANISRSHSGKGLCHGLLRHQDSARRQPGAGREFVTHWPIGRERPQCPALPAQ